MHIHTYKCLCCTDTSNHRFYLKFIPLDIPIHSWVSVSLQVFIRVYVSFYVCFPFFLTLIFSPSPHSSMSTFSFILSLSFNLSASILSFHSTPTCSLFSISVKFATITSSGKAIYQLCANTGICNSGSEFLLYAPQSACETKEMWVTWSGWVSTATNRFPLWKAIVSSTWKTGTDFVVYTQASLLSPWDDGFRQRRHTCALCCCQTWIIWFGVEKVPPNYPQMVSLNRLSPFVQSTCGVTSYKQLKRIPV